MKKWVVGNWKLHGDQSFIDDYVSSFMALLSKVDHIDAVSVGLCPPTCYIGSLAGEVVSKSEESASFCPMVGAQNVSAEASGAFTGEVSATMVKDCQASFSLAGHSERRQLFGETDALVAKKVDAILKAGITVILCVGETLSERNDGDTLAVVERQLSAACSDRPVEDWRKIVIAYEPVWAIGTGLTATPDQAQAVHAFMREYTAKLQVADPVKVPLLYGGSVKGSNASQLLAEPDIDGVLVGGASLKPDEFASIVAHAAQA